MSVISTWTAFRLSRSFDSSEASVIDGFAMLASLDGSAQNLGVLSNAAVWFEMSSQKWRQASQQSAERRRG